MPNKTVILGSMIFCLAGHCPVSAAVFPNEIQVCILTAVCSTPMLVQQTSTFSAYSYSDGGTSKFLFEYELAPSSNESTNFATTQLSGAAWVSAQEIYDLTQPRHSFALYLDTVTPTPTNLWVYDSDGLDVGLSMPTTDLLAGSSFFRLGEDQSSGGGFLEGDLETLGDGGQMLNHSFLPCLANTCEVGAEFNLLNMQYQQIGLTAQLVLDPGDERFVLYSQYQDWANGDFYYRSQSYGVVPVPAAAWLFGSGLFSLLCVARRRR